MRVPVSWLREYAELPAEATARDIAHKLIAAGLEVESVDKLGADLTGPLVVGRVLAIEELTEFKKPIRYCQVDIGNPEPQNIVCGATNFAEGELVVVILPGGVLPGGFEIGARKTYGKVSEGMICSERELGMGDGHDGILVLPESAGAVPGQDAIELLQLRDEVLDIAVTPDRGYTASIRGVAREAAIAYGVPFNDPAGAKPPEETATSYPASVADPEACSSYVLREVRGLDPAAPSPISLMRRLQKCGVRSISLAVDVTNYLMLELGQPLHAWDRGKLKGPIVVRRAARGERMETLDHVVRDLDPEDILITDDSGPVNIAGVMGGLTTEIDEKSTDIVIEAAHFSPEAIARTARRHKLHSDSSYRFERGVDRELQRQAAAAAARMLAELGGAEILPGETNLRQPVEPAAVTMRADHPDKVAGMAYGRDTVAGRLRDVGCEVSGDDVLTVIPPSWRPDLRDPNDLAEEVIRLEGYENIPARTPRSVAGRGLTPAQRLRRRVGRALAANGYAEVLNYPFASEGDWDALQLPADDDRRRALRLANPLTDEEPLLRTTLLPGLFRVLGRNAGRGFGDVALFEMGLVYRPKQAPSGVADDVAAQPSPPPVDRGPTAEELAAIEVAIPDQPLRVGVVLAGDRDPAGWWGPGRPANWADAIEAARVVAGEAGVELEVEADQHAPWHPGRCARLLAGGVVVGHAGELHPRVIKAYDLPARACAMELDLTRIEPRAAATAAAPRITTYPVATQDVALIVHQDVPAADVEAALRAGIERHGAGELLESIRLFDLYTGEQAGEGNKSLAYTLRFRSAGRTLTAEETTSARDAAVAAAAERVGAVLRGS
jgi:phenylalanyl-tRNA synthetase beta chain